MSRLFVSTWFSETEVLRLYFLSIYYSLNYVLDNRPPLFTILIASHPILPSASLPRWQDPSVSPSREIFYDKLVSKTPSRPRYIDGPSRKRSVSFLVLSSFLEVYLHMNPPTFEFSVSTHLLKYLKSFCIDSLLQSQRRSFVWVDNALKCVTGT